MQTLHLLIDFLHDLTDCLDEHLENAFARLEEKMKTPSGTGMRQILPWGSLCPHCDLRSERPRQRAADFSGCCTMCIHSGGKNHNSYCQDQEDLVNVHCTPEEIIVHRDHIEATAAMEKWCEDDVHPPPHAKGIWAPVFLR